MDKYKLIKEKGIKLKRIVALRDFRSVKKGEKGGLIEKEANLSQEGNCWVSNDAHVFGNAHVFGDALVSGNARVFGNAHVFGDALVSGNAHVFGDALVSGNAQGSILSLIGRSRLGLRWKRNLRNCWKRTSRGM